MFWRRKPKQIADEALRTATDLAEKSMTIGPTGVLLLLGGAAAGAAIAYLAHRTRQNKKAAR